MKKTLRNWWENRGKQVITVAIVLVALALAWCCYYAVYSHVKGGNSLATKINMMFGSSGDPIKIGEENRKDNLVTFLIAGKDGKDLDTIFIGVLDGAEGSVRLLSIPRDTLSDSDRNNKKICKAYEAGGMEGLKKELKLLTGLPIDRYLLVDYDGFIKLVNALGGVTLSVPQQMDYEDPSQGLSIHFMQGEQQLDGEQALNFVRFCGYADGDLGRIRAQQSFLKAFSKELITGGAFTKPKKLAAFAAESVETDLSAGELLWLAKLALQADYQQDISMEVLPGISANFLESTYYIVNETAALGMINSRYNPYQERIGTLMLSTIGQNLFDGWQWSDGSSSGSGYTPDFEEAALENPTRFCEYYYEYKEGVLENSLFADAMDTPDKTKKEQKDTAPTPTPKPVETLTIPKIMPSPTPDVVERDRFIVLDPSQNPEDYGIDPDAVEYLTPSPTPTPTPTPLPQPSPAPEGEEQGDLSGEEAYITLEE
ncbi:MAG: LCP family protein [Clostridia bacterium]|nr:LCP family protein [Clostridia bacterium]